MTDQVNHEQIHKTLGEIVPEFHPHPEFKADRGTSPAHGRHIVTV
jgi:hypothetical protein